MMKVPMRSIKLFATLFALCFSLMAWPQATSSARYKVELLVFRASNAAVDQRTAPATGASPAPLAPTASLQRLSSEQLRLHDAAKKLRSGGFVVLAHGGWLQNSQPWGSKRGFALQDLGIEVSGLTGQVGLQRGQYLHLIVHLHYSPDASSSAVTLKETRRVRLNERHYLDHPGIGVIALVTSS
jgi:hypothetical protein